MRTPKQLAAHFARIDAHDDTIEGFAILPALTRRTRAKVEVTLFRHWEGRRRILRFSGRANVNVAVDADILSGNEPNSTYALEATADSAEIESMARRHKRSWNVSYQKSIDPLPAKIAVLNRYVLFRVRLFGGVLEVLARSFTIKHIASG